jgi:hypothetical protein
VLLVALVGLMARCPNCREVVEWNAEKCAKCDAVFTKEAAWRPVPDSAEEAALIGTRLSPPPAEEQALPFQPWWPILAGALVGIALRLMFYGKPGGAYAAMMASFIYLAPVLVGATTVYLAERQKRRSWGYYAGASALANLLFVVGTFLALIEGLICAIVIVPMFVVFGVVGGVLMGVVCRVTKWPRHALYSLAVLPLVLGGLEADVATPSRFGAVERTVIIHAPPETVWRNIMHVRDIRPAEVERAWIYRIGVPLPVSADEEATPEGLVRKVRMAKDVHFDQVFKQRIENRYAYWTYRLYPDSFPPYALDDHVLVGGYYFDILDTSYRLTPTGEGTALTIRMGYRVTTQFNWYTEPLARVLLGNFEEIVLEFYGRRAVSGGVRSWGPCSGFTSQSPASRC